MTLELSSPAFSASGPIPVQHTCDGANTPPSLRWSGTPPGTKSFVLIVDDPDAPDPEAPKRTYVHWVVYDIPGSANSLGEGSATGEGRQGLNDEKQHGYSGPCPPVGRHRYFFKLYALDTVLDALRDPTKAVLEKAMHDHVLGHAELIGTYARAAGAARTD